MLFLGLHGLVPVLTEATSSSVVHRVDCYMTMFTSRLTAVACSCSWSPSSSLAVPCLARDFPPRRIPVAVLTLLDRGKFSASMKRKASEASGSGYAGDRLWALPSAGVGGWAPWELELAAPRQNMCFAALLHGDGDKFLAYACVLGDRLRLGSPGADRVLLCGPGTCCGAAERDALRFSGWERLVPVLRIDATHLDKSWSKRHAYVFTKLKALELPYQSVLLLDLDILPRRRHHADMNTLFELPAPAGKYWSLNYLGPALQHGERMRP